MKKKIALCVSFCLMLFCSLLLVSCENHEHIWSATWSSDATQHWVDCTIPTCEQKKNLADHTFDEGVVTTPATTEAEGVRTFTCTVCDHEKTEPIDKLPVPQTDAEKVAAAKAQITAAAIGLPAGTPIVVSENGTLTLNVVTIAGVNVTWTTTNSAINAETGAITRPTFTAGDATGSLTATITCGEESDTVVFDVKVEKLDPTDAEKIVAAKAQITAAAIGLPAGTPIVVSENGTLTLDVVTIADVTVTWTTTNSAINAETGAITRPTFTAGDATGSLTATITCGEETAQTVVFTITVSKLAQTDQEKVNAARAEITAAVIGLPTETQIVISENKTLTLVSATPTTGYAVTWASTNSAINASSGKIVRPAYTKENSYNASDATGNLTATITLNGSTATVVFAVTVKKLEKTEVGNNTDFYLAILDANVGLIEFTDSFGLIGGQTNANDTIFINASEQSATAERNLVIDGKDNKYYSSITVQFGAVVTIRNLTFEITDIENQLINTYSAPYNQAYVICTRNTAKLTLERVTIDIQDTTARDGAVYGIYIDNEAGETKITDCSVENDAAVNTGTSQYAYAMWTSNLSNTIMSGTNLDSQIALGIGNFHTAVYLEGIDGTNTFEGNPRDVMILADGEPIELLSGYGKTTTDDIEWTTAFFSEPLMTFVERLADENELTVRPWVSELQYALFTYDGEDQSVTFDNGGQYVAQTAVVMTHEEFVTALANPAVKLIIFGDDIAFPKGLEQTAYTAADDPTPESGEYSQTIHIRGNAVEFANAGRNLVIDGNGKTYNSSIFILDKAVVTIKNLNFVIDSIDDIYARFDGNLLKPKSGQAFVIGLANGATATLDNVSIIIKNTVNYDNTVYGIYVGGKAEDNSTNTITITGCTVTNNATSATHSPYGLWTSNLSATTMTDTTLTAKRAIGVGNIHEATKLDGIDDSNTLNGTDLDLFVMAWLQTDYIKGTTATGDALNSIAFTDTYFNADFIAFVKTVAGGSEVTVRLYIHTGYADFTFNVGGVAEAFAATHYDSTVDT